MGDVLRGPVVVTPAPLARIQKTGQQQQLKGLFDRLEQIASESSSLTRLVDALDPDNLPSHPGPYARALQACGNANALVEGRKVHGFAVQAGLQENLILGNHIVRMYGRCGSLEEASRAFAAMPQHNSVSWNALISAYAQAGRMHSRYCLRLFWRMQQEGAKVDRITFIVVLGVLSGSHELSEGKKIHSCIREFGIESDTFVATALVTMYSKCHCPWSARQMFDAMSPRSTVSWTAMVTAYSQHGHNREAMEIFHSMQQEGVRSDSVTYVATLTACDDLRAGDAIHSCLVEAGFENELQVGNALVNMYAKCGRLDKAREVFSRMQHRNVVSWTVIITGYSQHGQDVEALKLFLRMQLEGVRADFVTLLCMLEVCGNTSSLAEGRMVHACSAETGAALQSSFGNAIVSMYGKCGSFQDAQRVFDSLDHQDSISWTALINAYAQHGDSSMAVDLFRKMKQAGVDPDEVTYVSVLWACSHAGLLADGCENFYAMLVDDELVPGLEHCGCVVGLLGRAGWLREAENFLRSMDSDRGLWVALLGACSVHGDVECGKRAAERLLELDPNDCSGYVVLSNMIHSAGDEEEDNEA
ncbi:putative pentatricopeptide repeat-containing protein At3g47840 [Selaginella moellendorffii]|uniref:putative pentatricopeptide repeat-containing protein At3g47840 n=1 Tax=Selaginella moellendorffii TaxID=88036 RepID=UPI000D1C484C|nr:putative pentatricopeptide repeat-containing protein At3g47840 [Selaginella moellendorffii]XP_024531113.1 putative pentatricopeptide repeat-containing protein At3g47840 [Selaginella moellendorffii]|eukprot:XP_024531112.1 putative pentatricopeptide repeat-containing protein At3g47840 [Selaginella moellendorffii]